MPRPVKCALTALLLPAGLLLSGLPAALPAAADASAAALFGAFTPPVAGQSAAESTTGLETSLGRTLGIDRQYSLWDDVQPTPILVNDVATGRRPLLSIKPQTRAGTIIPWARIADGTHDADIRAQADGLRGLNQPLLLAFHHEPDMSSGYGSAADFVAAFRHYVTVFGSDGPTDVAFVVILTPNTYATNPLAWYPGDDVVDWIGTDAYNFGSCRSGVSGWRTLATAARAFYDWGSARSKPLVLAEWGSAEDSTQPGRKAAWLADAASTMAGWPALKAAAYFDAVGTCDWRLSTSVSATTQFRASSHTPWANGATTGWLRPATPLGPAPLHELFDLGASTAAGWATGSGISAWRLDTGDGTIVIGSGQPTTIAHDYPAGTWTATLTVTDPAGASATTHAAVVAAGPPTVSEGIFTGTAPTISLPAWVNSAGLSVTYYCQWGTTTGYGSSSPLAALPAPIGTRAVSVTAGPVRAGSTYHWRLVASSAAGTTVGPDRIIHP